MGVFTQQQAIISVVNVSYNLRITQYFRLAAEDSFDVIRLPAKLWDGNANGQDSETDWQNPEQGILLI